MKNKRLNNLFVRGGKSAKIAAAMALMLACDKPEDSPYAKIDNNSGFIYLIVALVAFFGPCILEYFSHLHDDNQQQR